MKDLIATAKELIEKAKDTTPGPWRWKSYSEWANLLRHKVKDGKDATAADFEFRDMADPTTITALCRLLLEYHDTLHAVKMDAIKCEQSDNPVQYCIAQWAVDKINKALAAAGKDVK
jgi:hypothetical protein